MERQGSGSFRRRADSFRAAAIPSSRADSFGRRTARRRRCRRMVGRTRSVFARGSRPRQRSRRRRRRWWRAAPATTTTTRAAAAPRWGGASARRRRRAPRRCGCSKTWTLWRCRCRNPSMGSTASSVPFRSRSAKRWRPSSGCSRRTSRSGRRRATAPAAPTTARASYRVRSRAQAAAREWRGGGRRGGRRRRWW